MVSYVFDFDNLAAQLHMVIFVYKVVLGEIINVLIINNLIGLNIHLPLNIFVHLANALSKFS